MPQSDNLIAHLLELLEPPVVVRRMSGGVGSFHGGTMFGLIARQKLFLKVAAEDQPRYPAAGEAPFGYQTKHRTHSAANGRRP